MAVYRQLQISFWQDGFILELTPEEKYFYIYLMTNSKSKQSGIFELPEKVMETETGYNRETIQKLLTRFIYYGKILYCSETREIMILNWMKYNYINSKNTIACIQKELREVKHKDFYHKLYEICQKQGLPVDEIFKGILSISEKGEGTQREREAVGTEDGIEMPLLNGGSSTVCEQNAERAANTEVLLESEEKDVFAGKMGNEMVDNQLSYDFEGAERVLWGYEENIDDLKPIQKEELEAWCCKVESGVVLLAIKEAVNYNARSFSYVEKILKEWLGKGLKTEKQVVKYLENWGKKT